MKNCKAEFVDHVGTKSVLCAEVIKGAHHRLVAGYDKADYIAFLSKLDFDYSETYGGPYGTIWYTDGTWSQRIVRDGFEWWEHKICPTIPPYLKWSPRP